MADMNHLNYIPTVLAADEKGLMEKEKTYRGSWKKRGGVGAFMMLARKWDRIENQMEQDGYDVFKNPGDGSDGTLIAEIRDLRRYLVLVEAELMAREAGTPLTNRGRNPVYGDCLICARFIDRCEALPIPGGCKDFEPCAAEATKPQ